MADIYHGGVDDVITRDTYLKRTSVDKYPIAIAYTAFNSQPFLQVIGLETWGLDAMKDVNVFGAVYTSKQGMVRYDSGVYALTGLVDNSTSPSQWLGRLRYSTPQLVEGGATYSWAWHTLHNSQYIPVTDVQDNKQGAIDIMAQKMEILKKSIVQDFAYAVLGNSNAPDYGTDGPSAVYSDLPNLVSVTQDRTVGGISTTNSWWQNQKKAVTDVGGGGELDRPLSLLRKVQSAIIDVKSIAGAAGGYIYLATKGAWLYWGRLAYADRLTQGWGATKPVYDALNFPYHILAGDPMVYDPAVTIPYGATANTEAIYGLNKSTFFIGIRREENFRYVDWEAPREHDQPKTYVASCTVRMTPGVTNRKVQLVIYNIPQNTD